MGKRVAIVSINPVIQDHRSKTFEAFYESFGRNTGNYMFTQAMFRQIGDDIKRIEFAYNPAVVNENYDHVVIPAANWLNANGNWDWFTEIIEKTEIPVTVIGIGLQADTQELDRVKVSDSCLRFAKMAASKSANISTRGDFTTRWMASVGIKNAVTTGCPSLYMKLNGTEPTSPPQGIAIQSTRYGATEKFNLSEDINRLLFRLAGSSSIDMIYQSEIEETEMITYGNAVESMAGTPKEEILRNLYGFNKSSQLFYYIGKHGKIFFDVDEWATFLKSKSGLVGTRLHGSIIALNSDVPAVLIPHDSRTSEVVDFAKIPVADAAALSQSTSLEELTQIVLDADLDTYRSTRSKNSLTYKQFLTSCGLKFKIDNLF